MKKISDRFYQIKKKHIILAIVKSAVCALSLGLFVTGVLLLALKLSAVTLAVGYYVLIGAGTALIGGSALFLLLFRPTDKQVAKRTDDDFGLNERVQTALEYSGMGGTIVQMQRADAEEKLNNLPARKFSFARIWQFVVIFVMALAIGVAGIVVPAKAAVVDEIIDPDSTPRQVTDLERAGVRELIANIEASSLVRELKTSVGDVLEQLLEELDVVNTEGTLSIAVNKAIDGTDSVLSPTLSCVNIGAALTEANQTYLGQAVTNGGIVYRYYMLTVYDEVRDFDTIRYNASNVKIVKAVDFLRNDLTLTISGGLVQKLDDMSSGINTALSSANISGTDGLYNLLKSFAEGLSQIRTQANGGADDLNIQNKISDLISKFNVDVTNEVSMQAYNAAINVFVSNRLKIIFGYQPLELPVVDTDKADDNTSRDEPDKDDPDENEHQSSGSGGTGEMEYGSDDMVWVPGRGYMKYGDVIDEYYSLINQYLHSDELTEEQKNMIRAYYDILFGSNKNK